jgi:hypothetical protein
MAGAWVKELLSVLWSLRTTPNSSTGYTLFFLLFRAEAVLPTDVRYCAPRMVAYVEEDAEKALADAQDLLDEAQDVALARSAVYQQSLRNYHSRRVHERSFKPGNLVLRLKQTSTSKLEPPWEAHTSSTRSSREELIDYTTLRQGRMSRTRGTPRSCTDSILRMDRPSLSLSLCN